jgi:outer membrane protein TolC
MNKRYFPLILLVFSLKIYSQDILSLDEAITQALSQNYNILLSVNDKEIAQTANSWYAAGKLPSVTANGVWNNSITNLLQKLSNGTVIERNGNRTSVINLNGQFSYRLYGGKRVFIAKKRLDIQESIAEEALKQDINQVVFDVTNSYININRLIKQKSAIQETISFFEERSKLSRSRFEIGTAGKNDYLQSQIDLNVQRNNEINLTNNIALAKMDLNQLLARDPNTPFEVQDIIVPETLPTQAEVMEAIESINPQITLLRYNQQILEQNALEIKALQKPSLFANGSLNFNYNNSSAGFNLFTQNYGPQAGLSVSVPLFTRALANQQIKINALDYKNQGLQIDALKHSLQSSAAESYQNYNNALQLIELEEQNLNIIREHNNIAMERFRKATITTVELRQAQLNLVEAQNRIINARYILKQSEVRLLYVMGRLIQ